MKFLNLCFVALIAVRACRRLGQRNAGNIRGGEVWDKRVQICTMNTFPVR